LFYMDTDMLVVKPFTEIWDHSVPFAAVGDVRMRQCRPVQRVIEYFSSHPSLLGAGWIETFDAGALLLRPHLQHPGILPTLLPGFPLRLTSLLQFTIQRVRPQHWGTLSPDIKLIHYTGSKAWKGGAGDVLIERKIGWDA
jgi:hypothetical protein